MQTDLATLRVEYGNTPLLEKDLQTDPMKQMLIWKTQARQAGLKQTYIAILSTVGPERQPASRAIYIREIHNTFAFCSSTTMRKTEHLKSHPVAALTFVWKEIHRQVCIEGRVKELPREKTEFFFNKAPRQEQLSRHATIEGGHLTSEEAFLDLYAKLERKFDGIPIPCPELYHSYELIPDRMEFWQGRANRLHDRFLYVKAEDEWVITRLSP